MNMMMPIVQGLVARDLLVVNYNPRDVCGTEVFKQMEAMVSEDKNLTEEMGKVFSATGGINLDSDFYAPYNWYDLTVDVAAIMDHHIAKASIIGFSTGGVIAQVTSHDVSVEGSSHFRCDLQQFIRSGSIAGTELRTLHSGGGDGSNGGGFSRVNPESTKED